jgi:hypothetical protein
MYGGVPGGYRNTINDNIVLILMIETLEGLKNSDAIAKVPGVTALFAAERRPRQLLRLPTGHARLRARDQHRARLTLRAGRPPVRTDRVARSSRTSRASRRSETAAIARGVAAELGPLGNTQAKPEVGPFVGR